MHAIQQAAMINLGSNPLISLIIDIIVVGIIVFVALWIYDTFLARFVSEPFKGAARWLIIAVGVLYIVDELLRVVFGISLFGH